MRSKNSKCLLTLAAVASVAVSIPAFADPGVTSCPGQIVVGKSARGDELGLLEYSTIFSDNIPSQLGIKHACPVDAYTPQG